MDNKNLTIEERLNKILDENPNALFEYAGVPPPIKPQKSMTIENKHAWEIAHQKYQFAASRGLNPSFLEQAFVAGYNERLNEELTINNSESSESGIELIAQERKEQIEKHGRTIESDLHFNRNGELSFVARSLIEYLEPPPGLSYMQWPKSWDPEPVMRMHNKPYKERLVIAGALIAAELDRLNHIWQQPPLP